jgi:hypothetical protein
MQEANLVQASVIDLENEGFNDIIRSIVLQLTREERHLQLTVYINYY